MKIATDPKLQPHSIEAEQSVLGAILLDNAVLEKARKVVTAADFYSTSHKMIFRSMLNLTDRGQVVDNVTLSAELEQRGELKGVGGSAYIAELIAAVGSAANVQSHARIVAEHARRRELIERAEELSEAAYRGESTEALDAKAHVLIQTMKAGPARKAGTNLLTPALLDLAAMQQLDIPNRARHLGWLPAGGNAMVFGPRGSGKTFLTLSLAASLATGTDFLRWKVEAPVGVLIVDGEMQLDELRARMTALLPCPPIGQLYFVTAEMVFHTIQRDLILTSERMRDGLLDILDAHPDIKVVILDNVSCLFTGVDEDKKRDWEPVNAWLIRLRHRGLATILVHHAGKGGQQRGTSGREDALDTVIQLDRPAHYDAPEGCHFELKFTKARSVKGDEVAPLDVRLEDLDGRLQWTYKLLEKSKEDQVRDLLEEGVESPTEIAEALGITRSYAWKLKRRIEKAGGGT